MIEPTIQQVRDAIESASPLPIKRALQVIYLTCGRAGEVAAYKTPMDKTAHPTGEALTFRVENYRPNLRNKQERDSLTANAYMDTTRAPNLAKLAKIKELALIFSVLTEKRDYEHNPDGSFKHVWVRECAVPLNPNFEPWAMPCLEYIRSQPKGRPLFPFNRHHLWKVAKEIFKDFSYTIQPYKRAYKIDGKYQYDAPDENGKKTLKTELQAERQHPAAIHAIRHWRKQELEDFYGFNDKELNSFGGWTMTEGANRAAQRYSKLPWRIYFPKLLAKKE